jgi:hypothetical protein
MAEKREAEFTVTDRRKFTTEGELRSDAPVEPEAERRPSTETRKPTPKEKPQKPVTQEAIPEAPSAAEQRAQEKAYKESSRQLDQQLHREIGERAREMEVTLEGFLASLYMTALVQLGLAHEQGGQPQLDLLGARHTIDTLSLLAEKTKNNLTAAEDNFLKNCLYELRMAYLEVTNAIARPPQPDEKPPGSRAR